MPCKRMTCKQKKNKKNQLLQKYESRCFWCGDHFSLEELTLDHLDPISKGGSNSLENLRLACLPCNHSRGNSPYPPQHLVSKGN